MRVVRILHGRGSLADTSPRTVLLNSEISVVWVRNDRLVVRVLVQRLEELVCDILVRLVLYAADLAAVGLCCGSLTIVHLAKHWHGKAHRLPDIVLGPIRTHLLDLVRACPGPTVLVSPFHVAFHEVSRRVIDAVLGQAIEAIGVFLGSVERRIFVVTCHRCYNVLAMLTVLHFPRLTVGELGDANARGLTRL